MINTVAITAAGKVRYQACYAPSVVKHSLGTNEALQPQIVRLGKDSHNNAHVNILFFFLSMNLQLTCLLLRSD